MGNDGTVRVNTDLAEIPYKPLPQRSPRGHREDFEALKAQVKQLQAQVTKLETEKSSIEAIAVGQRADFERERERSDKLMTNTMTLAAVAMSARAKAARLESELSARRSKFWMKLRTRRGAPASPQFRPNAPPRPEEPIMQLRSRPHVRGARCLGYVRRAQSAVPARLGGGKFGCVPAPTPRRASGSTNFVTDCCGGVGRLRSIVFLITKRGSIQP
jgi:hypothetical protein